MKNIFSIISILFLFFIQCSSLQVPSEKKSDLQMEISEKILNRANQSKLKAVSYSVISKNEILLMETAGIKDLDMSEAGNETGFKIGSVTKVFTALLVLKLVEEGKVKLDNPITDYLKDFEMKKRYPTRYPTVRELLTHHGGLPSDFFSGFEFSNIPGDESTEFRKLPLHLKEIYTADKPSKVMAYSNLSYSLLAILIERMGGMDLEEYARQKIFDPLGMNSTTYLNNLNTKNNSRGFVNGNVVSPPRIRDLGAGSMTSSSKDMSKFMMMINQNGMYDTKRLFKEETISEMFKIQNETSALDANFKMGIPFWRGVSKNSGKEYFLHGGDLPPFHAILLFDRDEKNSIFISTNTMSSSMQFKDVAYSVMDLLSTKPSNPMEQSEPIGITAEKQKEIAGTYRNLTSDLIIEPSGDELKTSLWPVYLEGNTSDTFRMKLRLFFGLLPLRLSALQVLDFHFLKEKDKKYLSLTTDAMYLTSYEAYEKKEISQIWKNRYGKYRNTGLDKKMISEIEIGEENGNPIMKGIINISNMSIDFHYMLTIDSDSLAFTSGRGRNSGDSIEFIGSDSKEKFRYSGFIFQKY
ncbi:MAG: serine hydrolase [Leptospiraceae bacterium]|nr:serine hydrolase [Leptospiraceae bacterium]MCP5512916.1 serine hydrolase [Leptospiraceae bacterium]